MRVSNRRWHQYVGFIGGITEHQTLIACALFVVSRFINASGDIRRLLADRVEHRARVAVKTFVGVVVSDINNHFASDLFQINVGFGGNFASNNHHTGFDERFARHAGTGVFFKQRIEHGIGNLVRNFIRMAFGNGF